jgi:glycerophosphoryl diester phosphodiesterase
MKPIIPLFLLFLACSTALPAQMLIHGHRGARAHLPENSIPGFLYAYSTGINTVELDVVVNADGQLVVSHDPWFNGKICLDSTGAPILKKEEKKYLIRAMSQEQIRRFDCGCQGHPAFPTQQALSVHKPLLSEVVAAIDSVPGGPWRINLEIKSRPAWEPEMQPGVEEFARIVYAEIVALKLQDRVIVQSFDRRILRAVYALDSSLSYGLLVADPRGVRRQIKGLGFTPDYFNPYLKLVGRHKVRKAHEMGLKVIVWTVNSEKDMLKMAKIGVDGVITDEPARAVEVLGAPPSAPQ